MLGLQMQTVYLMSLVVSVAMMAAMAWFFHASKHGLAMRATAFNQQVAQSLGIPVKNVFAMAWAISAVVSAVAGVVVAVVNGVSAGLSVYGIKVFPAVILGGLDSIVGAVLGGIIIGLLENLRAFRRQPVPALGQPVRDRAFLRPDRHPDDQALRPVRHQRHRAGVGISPWRLRAFFRPAISAPPMRRTPPSFPTATGRWVAIASIALLVALAPLWLSQYWLSILIQIGYLGDRGARAEHPGRLHRPDLDRSCGVLRPRRLHVGLSEREAGDAGVLRDSACGGRDRRRSGWSSDCRPRG